MHTVGVVSPRFVYPRFVYIVNQCVLSVLSTLDLCTPDLCILSTNAYCQCCQPWICVPQICVYCQPMHTVSICVPQICVYCQPMRTVSVVSPRFVYIVNQCILSVLSALDLCTPDLCILSTNAYCRCC